MPEPYIQRITIDLDGNKTKYKTSILGFIANTLNEACLKIKIDKILKEFKKLNIHHVTIKQSASKKGYHLTGWHKIGWTSDKLLQLRENLGDDKARIYLDRTHDKHIQVLFDTKRKKCKHTKK